MIIACLGHSRYILRKVTFLLIGIGFGEIIWVPHHCEISFAFELLLQFLFLLSELFSVA